MRVKRFPWLVSFVPEIPDSGGDSAPAEDQVEDTTPDVPAPATGEAEKTNEDSDGEGEKPAPDDEPLGEKGKKALDAERTLRRAAEAQAREARAAVEAAEKAADERVALIKARYEVAAANGIPAELVDRLQGSTRDELDADAKKLVEHLKPAYAPPVDPSQGKDREGVKGGGVAAGRDLYHETRKGKKG